MKLTLVLVSVMITPIGADGGAEGLADVFVQELVKIEPGKPPFPGMYSFGGAAAPKPVALKTAFRIAKYEVPQNLYQAIMGKNPSRWQGPRNSVEMVRWNEASEFCEKLTRLLREKNQIGADEVVRLPTVLEWEYCCCMGKGTDYCFGNDANKLGDYAWYDANAKGNDPPVGAKKPNEWGLYDMHGYVWEWVDDDGSSKDRVACGGAWTSPAAELKRTARKAFPGDHRGPDVGFRCVVAKKGG